MIWWDMMGYPINFWFVLYDPHRMQCSITFVFFFLLRPYSSGCSSLHRWVAGSAACRGCCGLFRITRGPRAQASWWHILAIYHHFIGYTMKDSYPTSIYIQLYSPVFILSHLWGWDCCWDVTGAWLYPCLFIALVSSDIAIVHSNVRYNPFGAQWSAKLLFCHMAGVACCISLRWRIGLGCLCLIIPRWFGASNSAC